MFNMARISERCHHKETSGNVRTVQECICCIQCVCAKRSNMCNLQTLNSFTLQETAAEIPEMFVTACGSDSVTKNGFHIKRIL